MNLFDNTRVAFSLKSDSDLERAYFLFKMISSQPLVRIGAAATNFALKANLPVEGLIRSTVFDHFCGGVNEEDCEQVIEDLYDKGVSSVLDYSVEGKETEEQFDSAMRKVLKIISFCKEKESMPIVVFKPTGFGRFALYEKLSADLPLSEEEKDEWDRVVGRFDTVCREAKENDVEVLIDAEESWMQGAADQLVEHMMVRYNTEKPVVFNTLQCYRWDRFEYLKNLYQKAKEKGFFIGLKIVRGAYMEKERQRAEEMGYVSPICESKLATDESFNNSMEFILRNIKDISIFIGSHNEHSSYLAIKLIDELGLEKNDERIWFGQLYGMSDHISFNLAKEGYNVAKYIPFGPVKDVMPYLIRRAEENTSVAGQTNRELELIKRERQRRKL